MTDIDIAAIRQQVPIIWAHWSEIQNTPQPGVVTDRLICTQQSADDIPTVLRWIEKLTKKLAELTAELAEARATADVRQGQLTDARAERDSAVKTLVAALAKSRARAATYANEVGNLTAENARVRQQRDEALAALEADEEPSHPDLGGARHHAPNGCDDCSVEPGDWHRYPECPGNLRAIEREKAEATR